MSKVSVVRFPHGGARFFTEDADGRKHLYADTYTKSATEIVAAAPEMRDALRLLVKKAPRRRNAGSDEFVGTEAVFDVAEQLLDRIDGEEATS